MDISIRTRRANATLPYSHTVSVVQMSCAVSCCPARPARSSKPLGTGPRLECEESREKTAHRKVLLPRCVPTHSAHVARAQDCGWEGALPRGVGDWQRAWRHAPWATSGRLNERCRRRRRVGGCADIFPRRVGLHANAAQHSQGAPSVRAMRIAYSS